MSSAYVETDYAWIRLKSERLAVFSPRDDDPSDDLLQEIPLLGLKRLCVREHVQITTEALVALLRAGIPVFYLDWKGDCVGSTTTPATADSTTRLRQYQAVLDPVFVLAQARALVDAKIQNQLRLLQRLNANRPRLDASAWTAFNQLHQETAVSPNLDHLRGLEGQAAARYYPLLATFLPAEFPFERRSHRPPHNAVNACLSFSYSLLYHDVISALHTRGLDPGLGLLHATENGRWALALDLMEPFRPALGDALALRMLSHQMLSPQDFQEREGGIYLSDPGRRRLIEQYERRLDRSFLSEQAGHRTTLRQAILDQAVSLKSALDGGPFTPFRLN